MRILFLTHYFPPEVNAPATRTYEHCKQWVEAGHDVTVLTCNPSAPAGKLFAGHKNGLVQKEDVDGISVVRLWSFIAPNSGFLKRILNFISSMFSMVLYALFTFIKCDVVVATSPQFFTGIGGVFVSFFKRRPLVLEIRDIWPESIVTVGAMRKSPLIRMLELMELGMYRAAKHIVTVGDGYKDNLLGKGVPAEKISVVTNGVFPEQFQGGDREKYRELLNGGDAFVCAYVGTVGMAHGLEVVVEAATELQASGRSDVQFWIVGEGARAGAIEALVQERKLANVTFLGRLPKREMVDLIAAIDTSLVHLKKSDLFSTVIPSKIFEMMAAEVPIIMGVEGGAQEIVLEAKAGVPMEPSSPESLLSAIDEVRRRGRDAFGGATYVAEHFSRPMLAAKMERVLCDVVGENSVREMNQER